MTNPTPVVDSDPICSLLHVALLLAVNVCVQGCEPSRGRWASLNKELVALQKDSPSDILSYESMRRSATYNSLAKDGQASDFIAMIEQDEYSYVKLAGYYALNERFPEKAFEGGTEAVCNGR